MNTPKLDINRLKERRENLGISKNEAARRIGISQPAYLRYESGERSPSLQMMQIIANEFYTSVDYLTGIAESSLPDTYIVRKSVQPELFEMISSYNQMNADQCKRLLSYIEKLQH